MSSDIEPEIEKLVCPRTGEACKELNNPEHQAAALFFSLDVVEPSLCQKYLDNPRYPNVGCGFLKLLLINQPLIKDATVISDPWHDTWQSIRGPDSMSDEQRDNSG